MARGRLHYRIIHRRMQAAAALGVVAGLLSSAHPAAAAGASNTIRLSGHVPPHASIRLSSWTLSSPVPRRAASRLRLGIANLSILANNRSFTVSLVAPDGRGRPGLVEATSGAVVPYELTYDGIGLEAVDGEIPLDRVLRAAAAEAGGKDIEVRLHPGASLGQGRYRDRLVLVIKAR